VQSPGITPAVYKGQDGSNSLEIKHLAFYPPPSPHRVCTLIRTPTLLRFFVLLFYFFFVFLRTNKAIRKFPRVPRIVGFPQNET